VTETLFDRQAPAGIDIFSLVNPKPSTPSARQQSWKPIKPRSSPSLDTV
jgi:hypothetical protein